MLDRILFFFECDWKPVGVCVSAAKEVALTAFIVFVREWMSEHSSCDVIERSRNAAIIVIPVMQQGLAVGLFAFFF